MFLLPDSLQNRIMFTKIIWEPMTLKKVAWLLLLIILLNQFFHRSNDIYPSGGREKRGREGFGNQKIHTFGNRVRKSRRNGLFWHEIDDGRVYGSRVSGRHLLLSVIRFRECQYSVMRNPKCQSSSAGLVGRQHLATRSPLVRSASIICTTVD